MELNKHGVNACIKAHLLPDEQMRKIGFTDYRKGYWYFNQDFYNEEREIHILKYLGYVLN